MIRLGKKRIEYCLRVIEQFPDLPVSLEALALKASLSFAEDQFKYNPECIAVSDDTWLQ